VKKMKTKILFLILYSTFCPLPLFAQAPIPLTINSRIPTAPGIDPYQASRTVYRVSFADGTNLVNLTGVTGWMSWSSNSYATTISTASVAVVDTTGGVIDFTFSASALNPTFGPGRYLYEVGLRGSQGITVYRQGVLTLRGSPYAVGVSPATWTTNAVNWGLINWIGLPTTMAGYGIVDGVDRTEFMSVSNQITSAQTNIDLHEALIGSAAHGLGTASTNDTGFFATSAQGALADTALQGESDTNAIAKLNIHTNLSALSSHPGFGTSATNPASAFATSAQGTTADTAGSNATAALAGVLAQSNRIDTLNNATGTLNTAVAGLLTSTNNLGARVTTLESNTNSMTIRISAVEASSNSLNTHVIALEGNTNAMTARISVVEVATNVLQVQVTSLSGATGVLNTATNTLQTQIVALKTATNLLNIATNSLQTQIAALNTSTGLHQTAILALQNATNALHDDVSNLSNASNFLNSSVSNLTASTNAINTRMTAAETVTNYISGQVTELKLATNNLQSQATSASATTNSLNTSVIALKAATNSLNIRAEDWDTAYGWGDHAAAGYVTTSTNIFNGLYSADRSVLGTNLSGLTQGTYTGSLTTVSYTGVTTLALGKTYAWGFTKQNSFGTSMLSIASYSLTKTATGAISNYFTFKGTDSNLVLRLDGDGSSKSDVSGIYVQQITNGDVNVAGDLNIGGMMNLGGVEMVNPALHIASTGTNVHGLGTASVRADSYFDLAGTAATVQTNQNTASNALNLAIGAVQTNLIAASNILYVAVTTETGRAESFESALQGNIDLASNTAVNAYNFSAGVSNSLVAETSARTNLENLQGLTNASFEARKVNTNDSRLTNARSWFERDYNLITNSPVIPSTNGLATTNWVVTQGYYPSSNPSNWSMAYDDTSLKAASNALNTRAGNLEASTGTLNTANGNLNAATNSINSRMITGMSVITGATASVTTNGGVLGLIVPSGGGASYDDTALKSATNVLNSAVTNHTSQISALQTSTGSLNIAVGNRVQKSGDTMTGALIISNNFSISGDLQFLDATSEDGYLGVDSGRILRWRNWNGGSPSWDVVEFETGNGTFHGTVTGASFSGNGAGLTNIPINYGSGTQNLYTVSVSNLLSFPVCGRTVNLIVTGSGLNPNVSGVYTQRADHLGNWAWHSTNSFYIYALPPELPSVTFATWTISSNLWGNYSDWASESTAFLYQPADLGSPVGTYAVNSGASGSPVVSYSIAYNPATASKMTLGSVSPTSSVVELRYNNAANDALIRFGDSNVFFRPVIVKDSLQASSLQITGGSPTNGAVWVATNTTGQGKWSLPVGFYAKPSANFLITNAIERTVAFATESFDHGNNFDGSIFTAPVNGDYSFDCMCEYDNANGGSVSYAYLNIYVNTVIIADGIGDPYVTPVGRIQAHIACYYLTNGAQVRTTSFGVLGYTNRLTATKTHFSGTLIRELP